MENSDRGPIMLRGRHISALVRTFSNSRLIIASSAAMDANVKKGICVDVKCFWQPVRSCHYYGYYTELEL